LPVSDPNSVILTGEAKIRRNQLYMSLRNEVRAYIAELVALLVFGAGDR
jgi:hypothetical protein